MLKITQGPGVLTEEDYASGRYRRFGSVRPPATTPKAKTPAAKRTIQTGLQPGAKATPLPTPTKAQPLMTRPATNTLSTGGAPAGSPPVAPSQPANTTPQKIAYTGLDARNGDYNDITKLSDSQLFDIERYGANAGTYEERLAIKRAASLELARRRPTYSAPTGNGMDRVTGGQVGVRPTAPADAAPVTTDMTPNPPTNGGSGGSGGSPGGPATPPGNNNGNGSVPPGPGTNPTVPPGTNPTSPPTPDYGSSGRSSSREILSQNVGYEDPDFVMDPNFMTVEGRMNGLLQRNGDYMQNARLQANEEIARRGLNASSIAVGASQRAAIESALPIAQQDAQTYYDRARTRYTTQAEAAMQGAQYDYNSALSEQDYFQNWAQAERNNEWDTIKMDLDGRIKERLAGQQQLFTQANMEQDQQNQLERIAAQVADKTQERMDNINAQFRLSYAQAQERTAERISAEVQSVYQNGEMSAAEQNAAVSNIYSRWQSDTDFIDRVYSTAQDVNTDVGTVSDLDAFDNAPLPSSAPTGATQAQAQYYNSMSPEARESTKLWFDGLAPSTQNSLVNLNSPMGVWKLL